MSNRQTDRRTGVTRQFGGLGAPGSALDPLGAPGTTGASRTTPGAPGLDPTGYGQAQLHRNETDVETGQSYAQVTSGFGSKAAQHNPLKTEARFGGSGQSRDPHPDPLGGSGWSVNPDESASAGYNTSIRGSKIETGTGGATVDTFYAVQVTKIPVSAEDIGHVQAQQAQSGQGQLRRNDDGATGR